MGEAGEGEEPPPPMTEQGFRDFMATHVVLEDEPAPLRGNAAEKAIVDAFGSFDKVLVRERERERERERRPEDATTPPISSRFSAPGRSEMKMARMLFRAGDGTGSDVLRCQRIRHPAEPNVALNFFLLAKIRRTALFLLGWLYFLVGRNREARTKGRCISFHRSHSRVRPRTPDSLICQGGQDPSIAQDFMTKVRGFPRTPSLQQVPYIRPVQ